MEMEFIIDPKLKLYAFQISLNQRANERNQYFIASVINYFDCFSLGCVTCNQKAVKLGQSMKAPLCLGSVARLASVRNHLRFVNDNRATAFD